MLNRWSFLLNKSVKPGFEAIILHALEGWKYHGSPVSSIASVGYNQVIFVEATSPVSGCGIDSMMTTLKTIAQENQLEILPASWIAYLDGNQIACIDFREIQAALAEGHLHANTIILDFLAWAQKDTLEKPLIHTWLAKYLPEKV